MKCTSQWSGVINSDISPDVSYVALAHIFSLSEEPQKPPFSYFSSFCHLKKIILSFRTAGLGFRDSKFQVKSFRTIHIDQTLRSSSKILRYTSYKFSTLFWVFVPCLQRFLSGKSFSMCEVVASLMTSRLRETQETRTTSYMLKESPEKNLY